MSKTIFFVLGFMAGWLSLVAQEILLPQQAVQIGLENNYGIRLARNATSVAENNTSRFNTGELPSFRVNSGINYGLSGSEIRYHDANIPAGSSWVVNGIDYNAGISMNYLVYDFGGRELNKQRLGELLSISKLEERKSIEGNLLAILSAYYNIALLQENLYAQAEVLDISRDRKERAEYQLQYGKSNRLVVLNAAVDINRDSIDLLNLQQQLANEKRDLNLLLGRAVGTPFEIDTSMRFAGNLTLESLMADALEKNVDLLLAKNDLALSELDIRINETVLKPEINAVSSLGLFGGWNDRNAAVRSQFGSELAAGVSLSWNLFDGGYAKVRNDNLRILKENQQLLMDQQWQVIERNLRNAWTSRQNQLYVAEVEFKNIQTAKLNFERTAEQYRLGQVSSVEFRQAQLNRLYAQMSYNRARFIAKVTELSLLQLSGRLERALEE